MVLWNSNLLLYSSPGPKSTREIISWMPLLTVGANDTDMDPEWLNWRTTTMLNTCCLYHSHDSHQSPGVDLSVSCWAPKKQIAFYWLIRHWNSVGARLCAPHTDPQLGSGTLDSVQVRTGPATWTDPWILNLWRTAHAYLHHTHTHVHNHLLTLVPCIRRYEEHMDTGHSRS